MFEIRLQLCDAFSSSKVDILDVFNTFNIKCSNITIPTEKNEFMIYCNSSADVDLVFQEACMFALDALGCIPVLPPELKAKRTVILKSLDTYIYDLPLAEIVFELNKNNENLHVVDAYKFPNSRTVKITFSNENMASTCLENGLNIFIIHLSPNMMQREEFIQIPTCYRCFSLNTHSSNECKKETDYVICSKCAVIGHDSRYCSSNEFKCINCEGNHSTLSLSCPIRIAIIKTKRVGSFSNVVKQNTPSLPMNFFKYDILKDSIVKSVVCHAVGRFAEALDNLQKLNNLPKFQLGNISSWKHFFATPPNVSPLQGAANGAFTGPAAVTPVGVIIDRYVNACAQFSSNLFSSKVFRPILFG